MDTRGDDRPGAPACRMRTDRHNFHGHRAGYRNDGSLSGQKTVPCKRAGSIAFFSGSGRAFSAALLRAKRPRFPICQPAFEPDTPVGGKPAFSPRTYLRQSRTSVGKKQKTTLVLENLMDDYVAAWEKIIDRLAGGTLRIKPLAAASSAD